MTYTIPTNGKPTPASRKAWAGAAIGSFFLPAPILGSLVGAAIGYYMGRQQQKDELESGMKTVESPTYWNSGLSKGWVLSGLILLGGVALSMGGLGAALSLLSSGTAATTVLGELLAGASALTLVAGVVGSIAAPIYGAVTGKKRMEKEHQAAKEYVQEREASRSFTPSVSKGKTQSPNLIQDISYGKNHVQGIAQGKGITSRTR
jgi:hypothetical protein